MNGTFYTRNKMYNFMTCYSWITHIKCFFLLFNSILAKRALVLCGWPPKYFVIILTIIVVLFLICCKIFDIFFGWPSKYFGPVQQLSQTICYKRTCLRRITKKSISIKCNIIKLSATQGCWYISALQWRTSIECRFKKKNQLVV